MEKLTKSESIAVEKSIKHWKEDILAPMVAREPETDSIVWKDWNYFWKKSKKMVPCYSNNCGLCQLLQTKDGYLACNHCTYFKKHGDYCYAYNEA